jgi:signal transduction histidine kinase
VINIWPRTLVGRTVVVLFVAILVSNGLGLAAYLAERRTSEVIARERAIAERVVAAARLLEGSLPAERRRQLWSLRGPGLRMQWAPEAMIEEGPTAPRLRSVRRAFADELAAEPADALRLALGGSPPALDGAGEAVVPGPGYGRHGQRMSVMQGGVPVGEVLRGALRLGDGSWLNFAAPLAPAAPIWTSSMLLLIGGASFAAAAIAAIAVWRASAPLSMFAVAAERLGRDLNAPALDEVEPAEVARAARAFNGMQARLQHMVRQRMQMLAAMSHDLRTPITRLRLRAELLEDAEQQEKMLADLDQIEALIAGSLEYARDAFTDERPAATDLAVLVQTTCDEAEDAGGAALYKGPDHAAFVARPVALRRALANLIDNAIKYGRSATVTLALLGDKGTERAVITVDDDGPGLAEEERVKVFEPFYRPDGSRSRDSGGVGLGLAIVKAAAVAHGGTVTLTNRGEGGLRATLTLPRAALPRPDAPSRGA